jgi:hypothetical protein
MPYKGYNSAMAISCSERDQGDGKIVVRRATRYTSEDLHRALFEEPPAPRTLAELRQGVREHIKSRHARC